MKIIEVKGLSKKYPQNSFYSLNQVSFSLQKGEIVGLIGKNGAGKSTLLKLIAKAQRPSAGTVLYQGQDLYQQPKMLTDFGLMIEPVFYPNLTVEDNLRTYLAIHQQKIDLRQIEKVLKLVDLWQVKKRKPASFSFGMKQRTALALALITRPKFLMLDEPFVGLDPVGVRKLIAILQQWSQQQQTTMLISSHQLSELASICDRYLMLEAGCLKEPAPHHSLAIVIELNSLARQNRQLIRRLVQNYALSFQEAKLAVPLTLPNADLNLVLAELAAQQLIKKIRPPQVELAQLFSEVSA